MITPKSPKLKTFVRLTSLIAGALISIWQLSVLFPLMIFLAGFYVYSLVHGVSLLFLRKMAILNLRARCENFRLFDLANMYNIKGALIDGFPQNKNRIS